MAYDTLSNEARELEMKAGALRLQAEEEHKKERKGNITAWLGYTFESSSALTPEFAEFSRQIKKELIRVMAGWELKDYSRGHFYFSAFFEKAGRYIYVSCSDVRYFKDDWYNNLLVRTAEGVKDYTGGRNTYATLPELKENAEKLIK